MWKVVSFAAVCLVGWMQAICLLNSYLVHPRHLECFLTRNLENIPSQKRHQLEKVGTKPLEVCLA